MGKKCYFQVERSVLLLHIGSSPWYLKLEYDPAARLIILSTGEVKNINFEQVNLMWWAQLMLV